MAYTFLIYFVLVECTAFHEFSAICASIVVGLSFVFAFAHSRPDDDVATQKKRPKFWILLICKIANVTLTIIGFITLFQSDMYFDIAEDIKEYAAANNMQIAGLDSLDD